MVGYDHCNHCFHQSTSEDYNHAVHSTAIQYSYASHLVFLMLDYSQFLWGAVALQYYQHSVAKRQEGFVLHYCQERSVWRVLQCYHWLDVFLRNPCSGPGHSSCLFSTAGLWHQQTCQLLWIKRCRIEICRTNDVPKW